MLSTATLLAAVPERAEASPWSVPRAVAVGVAVQDPSPEQLLEQAQVAFDQGRYRESADRAAQAYGALPLANRASAYGENAVLQATAAYREAWLRQDDAQALRAGRGLLQAHVDDYAAHGEGEPPAAMLDELRRWERLELLCRSGPVEVDAPVGPVTPPVDREQPLRIAAYTTVAAGATLSVGAAVLSSFVFGYGPSSAADGTFEPRISAGHLGPAIPLAVAGGVVGGLGMHVLVARGKVPRRTLGIAATVVGGVGVAIGAALMGTGAGYWPDPGDDGLTVAGRRDLSVNLQSAGLAVLLGSLGVLGPGIGALATRSPPPSR